MQLTNSMDVGTFLDAIITCPQEGWFCLSLASPQGTGFADMWYHWPRDRAAIIEAAAKHATDWNVYFSSFLFSAQSRIKGNVLPTRTIQADLDEADLATLPITPFAIVSTSPGRSQGYWILNDVVDLDTLETLSRKLTYAIPLCDHSGWPLGRTARLPQTINHKYLDGPKPVLVASFGSEPVSPSTFELLPDADRPNLQADDDWLTATKAPLVIGPNTILEQLREARKLTAKIVQQYNKPQDDRSAALWALTTNLFRAGCDRNTVYQLALGSANNKFKQLRYGGERELAKDILRAEAVAQRKYGDARSEIRELRLMPGHSHIIRSAISRKVMEVMQAEGDFIHTNDNALWYVKRDIGRPVAINRASEYLTSMLNIRFGLNRTEVEASYSRDELIAYVVSLPSDTEVGAMSYYNPSANTVLLHTGVKDVLAISTNSVSRLPNGGGGVLFPWKQDVDPFSPDSSPLPGGAKWHEILFEHTFDNVVDMQREEAMALMRVWTIFILLRNAAVAKPILTFLGAPGAGKSTIMRRLYRLYYGGRRELLNATTEEKLDLVSTDSPFMVLDGLDTWQPWVPNWLSTAITKVSVPRRKLYTDGDLYLLTRQAVIGLTAHNPKFGREDVADRMLLITFNRLAKHDEESVILDNILRHRNRIWGGIVEDIQQVLNEPPVLPHDVLRFRIADFAAIGLRIARALGISQEFTAALKAVAVEQRLFSLEEEVILVSAIKQLVADDTRRDRTGQERSSGVLWSELALFSGDPETFRRVYGNAVRLSKKMQAMTEPLSQLFEITSRIHAEQGTKVWTLKARNGIAGLTAEQLQQLTVIERSE